ncbi:MAG: DMT family transporter [Ilumatobacteraceae bacterium]
MNPRESRSADTHLNFGPFEWALSVGLALTWGSSFLLINLSIRHFDSTVVPFARTAFGALALAFLPGARQKIARRDWPLVWFLGLVWMAIPFLLYPIAEQTVSSSITGMMNGGLPVVVAVVTAIWTRSLPSAQRIFAVAVGCAGIVLIALPSIVEGSSADVRGIVLLLIALVCYAVAVNAARPLHSKYHPVALMLHVELAACVISTPLGLSGLTKSEFSWVSLGAVAALGALGTGIAFALFATLAVRTGPVRSMIPTYFTPIVGTFLGIVVNDETLIALSLLGMIIVIVGAWLTSRPDVGATI